MRELALILCIFLSGCGWTLHTVYLDGDRGVFHEDGQGQRTECQRAYSVWDGATWQDFYGPPCNVFVKRRATEVKTNVPPTTCSRH